ncbi:hypothetical protein [Flavobacterium koreense]
MNYTELSKLRIETFSFIEDCFNHNSKIADFEDHYFFSFTSGLINFGSLLLRNLKLNPLTIYQTEHDTDFGFKTVYYAIDRLGVSHGYIYGPNAKYEFNPLCDLSDNLYFGNGKVEEYSLVYNWKNKPNQIDFNDFFSYLPLKLSFEKQFKLYSTFNNRKIIYQDKYSAFEIPFEELLLKELKISFVEDLTILNKSDYFEFKCVHTIHRFKQDNISTLFEGRIDKKTFEIIEDDVEI